MSWLRVDDGFAEHPKVIALGGPTARWAWLEILTYCARRQTGGIIPPGIADVLRRATPELLAKAEKVELIDRLDDGRLYVHDWAIYNGGTVDERVTAYLTEHPEATANEVQRAVGGKRELVLASIHWFRGTTPDGSPTGSLPVPKRFTRARSPSPPHVLQEQEPKAVALDVDAEPDEANGPGQADIQDLHTRTTNALRSL